MGKASHRRRKYVARPSRDAPFCLTSLNFRFHMLEAGPVILQRVPWGIQTDLTHDGAEGYPARGKRDANGCRVLKTFPMAFLE